MKTPFFATSAYRALISGLLASSGVALLGAPASASAVTNQSVPGAQTGVSCLTSTLCVLVGSSTKGTGDVIVVSGGKAAKPVEVKGAKTLYAISCPVPAGCVAVGRAAGSSAPWLVELDSKGKVLSSAPLRVAAGISFSTISCKSMFACELAGTTAPTGSPSLALAQWDGNMARVFSVPVPRGAARPSLSSISCMATNCVAVGSAATDSGVEGLVVDIVNWRRFQVRTTPGDWIGGVACTSTSLCFASGYDRSAGFVLTIGNGAPGLATATPGDKLDGIACNGSSCLAVGVEPFPGRGNGHRVGSLVHISDGRATGTQLVAASGGFTSVGGPLIGPGFAAVGPGQLSGSQVATLP